MEKVNIFENAKFGDKFLTRGRRTAIYIKPSNHSDLFKHYLIIEGDDFLTGYYNDGRQTENDKTISDIVSCQKTGDYGETLILSLKD